MQDIGNELKNVLVNNKIGKNLPKSSTSAASAVPSTTPKSIPRSKFRLEQKPRPKDLNPHVDLSGKLDSKGKLTQRE
jgi:hypothetical protein